MNDLTPQNTALSDAVRQDPSASESYVQKRMRPSLLVLQGILALGIVAGAGFAMQAMLAEREAPPQRPVREQSFTIDTVVAKRDIHQPRLVVYGDIVAGNRIDLRGSVGGTVVAVSEALQSGGVVSLGTELVTIDPFTFETALAEARIAVDEAEARVAESEARKAAYAQELETAQAQRDLAEQDLTRAETLLSRGSVTQQTVDQRRQTLIQRRASVDQVEASQRGEDARLRQQRAALERARLQVIRAERNLADTRITAPVAGIVEAESVALGQTITANQSIATLVELAALEARFVLSDAQYGRIAGSELIGAPAEIVWQIGGETRTYSATISRIGAGISQNQGGVTLYARLTLDEELQDIRPGAFVSVSLNDRAYPGSYKVPETALYDENRVYIVDGERLAARAVTPLAFDGDAVILQGDLAEGAQIMTTRIAEAGDGLKIRVIDAQEEVQDSGSERSRGGGNARAKRQRPPS